MSDGSDDVSPFEPPVYGMYSDPNNQYSPVSSPSVYGRGRGKQPIEIYEIPDFDPPVYEVGD